MPGFKILVPLVNIFKLSILSVNGIPVNNQLAVNPLTIDPENVEDWFEAEDWSELEDVDDELEEELELE